MADNVTIADKDAAAKIIATDEVTRNAVAEHEQIVKIGLGAEGAHDLVLDSGQQTKANSLPVAIASDQDWVAATGLGKAVDAVPGATDTGVAALVVRKDTPATLTPADGDYTRLFVGSTGRLWGSSVVTDVTPGTSSGSLGKQEDSAHNSGDTGVMLLGVRNTAHASRTDADGDYTPIAVDAEGCVLVVGCVVHDAQDKDGPIKIGGRADATFQAAVADGDRVDALFDVYGQLRVRVDNANKWSYHSDGSTALTDSQVQASPGAGLSVFITDIIVSSGAATAMNVFLEEGSTKILGPYYLEAVAGRGLAIHFVTAKKCTAATAVTVTTSAAIAHSVDISGFIAP